LNALGSISLICDSLRVREGDCGGSSGIPSAEMSGGGAVVVILVVFELSTSVSIDVETVVTGSVEGRAFGVAVVVILALEKGTTTVSMDDEMLQRAGSLKISTYLIVLWTAN
jgi:hypothetical protein